MGPPLLGLALVLGPLGPLGPLGGVASASDQADRTTRAGAPSSLIAPTPSRYDASADPSHVGENALRPKDRPPVAASKKPLRADYDAPRAVAAAACDPADFASRTGSELVRFIKSVPTSCINTLFSLSGSNAYYAFREAQMVSVAYGYRDNAQSYDGTNSAGTAQLVLYLRAGYFVQWYDPDTVGPYGAALKAAIRSGLDGFFANSHSRDVNDVNGEILSESVVLIDSAQENARYLYMVKRMLQGYNSSYNSYWWMVNAVNSAYTVTFRGHQLPEFVSAVVADPSILEVLRSFAVSHLDLLGTDKSFLTSNAGRELGRFLQHSSLLAQVRPMARDLLSRSAITGKTASLWVGVAEMADYYDKANCAYYDVCNLAERLKAAVLPVNHTCSATLRIRAQQMASTELAATCSSLANQDAYFHNLVADSGPVANDKNTTLEVVAFDSSTDYQTYAGAMFGIDTNNGGMYLEGDPSVDGNQPRFIAYEAEWVRPKFEIWNLNHEYTHYLDGRFDMYGDFTAGMSTPTVWWVEGFAEYVSYGYRNVVYQAAIDEAGKRTYSLRTMFDTEYGDTTRVYRWGYLSVRFMFQSHRADLTTLLGYYRTGNWNGARSFLTSTIGSRYDNEWYTWLTACGSGNCGGTTNPPDIKDCTGADIRALGQNCARRNISVGAGNYGYHYILIPSGTTSLKITSSGGTGNCDLYFHSSSWATTSNYTARSAGTTNAETLTVTPRAGYNYVSLYGTTACSGVTLQTVY